MMAVAPTSLTVPPPGLITIQVEGKLSASHASPSATDVVAVTCTPTRLSGGTPCGVTPVPESTRVKVTPGARMSRLTMVVAVGATAGGGGRPEGGIRTDTPPGLAV